MAKNRYVRGTLVLSINGVFLKTLGMWYRVYISRLLGAEGMGLIGLISPIYSFIFLTLTSGVSVSVSRIVARERAADNQQSARKITLFAALIIFVVSVFVAILLLLFAKPVSSYILKDQRTYLSLLVIVPFVPVISVSAAIRGYFYGCQKIIPVAFAQILEQVTKIGTVIFFVSGFLQLGLFAACALATFAMALGELTNLLIVMIAFFAEKGDRSERLQNQSSSKKLYGKRKFEANRGLSENQKSTRKLIKEIIKDAVPVSLNRMVMSAMSSVEFILIPASFVRYGYSSMESISEYGRLTGMAMPLIFIPMLFTSSLAINLVPALSEAVSTNSMKIANQRIARSISISVAVGCIFWGIFMIFGDTVSELLYPGQKVGEMVQILSGTCVFLYLQQTFLGILNGLSKQAESLVVSIFGCLIRILFVLFIIPIWGISGYITAIVVSGALICVLNYIIISKTTGLPWNFQSFIVYPFLCGLVAYGVGKISVNLLPYQVGYHSSFLIGLVITSAASMAALEFFKIFSIKSILPVRKPKTVL